jgi:outer membrane immunogenic protein
MAKRTLLGSVSLGALSAALAGAIPAAAQTPPIYSWTGFYIGGNVGYFGLSQKATDSADSVNGPLRTMTTTSYALNTAGPTAGVVGGFNKQFNSIVLGIETDFSWVGANGARTEPRINLGFSSWANDLFTVRGRIGVVWGNALFYGTGGYASANITNIVNSFGSNGSFRNSSWRDGGIGGGGLEIAFAKRWTVKFEGLYARFNSVSALNTGPFFTAGYKFIFRNSATIARMGFNFRF